MIADARSRGRVALVQLLRAQVALARGSSDSGCDPSRSIIRSRRTSSGASSQTEKFQMPASSGLCRNSPSTIEEGVGRTGRPLGVERHVALRGRRPPARNRSSRRAGTARAAPGGTPNSRRSPRRSLLPNRDPSHSGARAADGSRPSTRGTPRVHASAIRWRGRRRRWSYPRRPRRRSRPRCARARSCAGAPRRER